LLFFKKHYCHAQSALRMANNSSKHKNNPYLRLEILKTNYAIL